MARLLDWPIGLGLRNFEWLSGPQAVGASSTQAIGGFTQTSASPFGALEFKATFQAIQDLKERRHRGMIIGLHGGANAVRIQWRYGATLTPAEAGIVGEFTGGNWSNGEPWSNGMGWAASYPVVDVAAAAVLNGTEVYLADTFWGHGLGMGDLFGFFPFHFGWYFVTEVIADGHYRIWPPLRKALTTDSYATLSPTIAARLKGTGAAQMARNPHYVDGATATFVEVFDYDVRDYFTD